MLRNISNFKNMPPHIPSFKNTYQGLQKKKRMLVTFLYKKPIKKIWFGLTFQNPKAVSVFLQKKKRNHLQKKKKEH